MAGNQAAESDKLLFTRSLQHENYALPVAQPKKVWDKSSGPKRSTPRLSFQPVYIFHRAQPEFKRRPGLFIQVVFDAAEEGEVFGGPTVARTPDERRVFEIGKKCFSWWLPIRSILTSGTG
jgi:hypothetical protein